MSFKGCNLSLVNWMITMTKILAADDDNVVEEDDDDDVVEEDDDDDVVADDGDGNLMSELHASPVPRNTHRPHLCNTPNTYIYM